jgi:UDP-glucose 4-epimerase
MKKKNIIVFGAAGFIGTYLIDELLKQNFQVIASDISEIGEMYYRENKIPYLSIDITNMVDFEKLRKMKFDAVIHLAALQPANLSEKNYDPKSYINVNVMGTLNILEFCRKNEVGKLIYACSHRNTQGLWKKDKAIREDEGRAIKHSGEYAMFSISESTAQDCIQYYSSEYGLKSINFRLPPVYGYGPHTEIFKNGRPVMTGFQTFIERAIACEPIEMWGDSSVGRDIIYVKDVVSAFIKALNNDNAQGIFNITSGRYLTLKEQVETTVKVFWGDNTKPKIVELPDKPHNMDSFLYDNSKAKRELDWIPQYSFEEMLIDYKKEMKSKRFKYLVEKRKMMLNEN